MTETSPEPTSNPEPEPLAPPAPGSQPDAEDRNDGEKPPAQTAGQTYLADDVSNLPTGEVEQAGPVTYKADHVPEDAQVVLESKVIGAPETERPAGSGADVQTG